MKELSIQDCQIVNGGAAPLIWAAAGIATYVGNKIYSGEEITALGVASSAIGSGVGGAVSTALRVTSSLRPIVGGFAGGAAEGFISNSSQGIKSSLNSSSICNNQSGSDYGDGCNYQ